LGLRSYFSIFLFFFVSSFLLSWSSDKQNHNAENCRSPASIWDVLDTPYFMGMEPAYAACLCHPRAELKGNPDRWVKHINFSAGNQTVQRK
jgi:hypothetical protein